MVVVQQLEDLFDQAAAAAANMQPKAVSMIDAGDGSTVANYARAYPATVAALLSQIGDTLGIDIDRVLKKAERPSLPAPSPPPRRHGRGETAGNSGRALPKAS